MHTLKSVTTVLIWILMLIFIIPLKEAVQERNKANIAGFGFMGLVYALSLICIWF